MSQELPTVVTIDHSVDHYPVRDYDRPRTIHLLFLKDLDGYTIYAWGAAFPHDGGGLHRGRIIAPHAAVAAAVDDLQTGWREQLLERTVRGPAGKARPFVDEINPARLLPQEALDQIWLELARAGNMLYSVLFDTYADEGLREIARRLVHAVSAGEQVITVESDDLFVPWGMLYSTPAGTDLWADVPNVSPDGFWGYHHLIEHSFSRAGGFDSRINVDQVVVGLNVDDRVDKEYPPTPFITSMIEFFQDRAKTVVRRRKDELARALQNQGLQDHIIYFGCHCHLDDQGESSPYLVLGDDQKIFSSEFLVWLNRGGLPTRPVVFVAACKGGRLAGRFYPSFGQHLLRRGARCLIGPQIDLPRLFARDFSRRLFAAFITQLEAKMPDVLPPSATSSPAVAPLARLGDTLRDVTRELADHERNPLGLAFSLYRGIDVHLAPPAGAA